MQSQEGEDMREKEATFELLEAEGAIGQPGASALPEPDPWWQSEVMIVTWCLLSLVIFMLFIHVLVMLRYIPRYSHWCDYCFPPKHGERVETYLDKWENRQEGRKNLPSLSLTSSES